MHQLWPARIIGPQHTGTPFTKASFSRTLFSVNFGMVNTEVLLSLNFQGLSFSAQIYGIPPSSCRLSTDRAVAQIEGDWMGRLKFKLNRATMTGTFK